jgi:phosphohistidine phosphatase
MNDAGCVPDLVLCSTARRTRQTWELAVPRLTNADPPVVLDERLYGATAAQLLAVVRDVPPQRRSVLVIGHHPGVQDLVLLLADDAVEGDALARARTKFPTSAVAVLALNDTWARLSPGDAVLTHFAVPRGLKH